MYNYDEIATFSCPETRLKQVILKLTDQERANHDLKNQMLRIKKDMEF
jgi:hypothetical protein